MLLGGAACELPEGGEPRPEGVVLLPGGPTPLAGVGQLFDIDVHGVEIDGVPAETWTIVSVAPDPPDYLEVVSFTDSLITLRALREEFFGEIVVRAIAGPDAVEAMAHRPVRTADVAKIDLVSPCEGYLEAPHAHLLSQPIYLYQDLWSSWNEPLLGYGFLAAKIDGEGLAKVDPTFQDGLFERVRLIPEATGPLTLSPLDGSPALDLLIATEEQIQQIGPEVWPSTSFSLSEEFDSDGGFVWLEAAGRPVCSPVQHLDGFSWTPKVCWITVHGPFHRLTVHFTAPGTCEFSVQYPDLMNPTQTRKYAIDVMP